MLRIIQLIGIASLSVILAAVCLAFFLGRGLEISRSFRVNATLEEVEMHLLANSKKLINEHQFNVDDENAAIGTSELNLLTKSDSFSLFEINSAKLFKTVDRIKLQKLKYHTEVTLTKSASNALSIVNAFKMIFEYSSSINSMDHLLDQLKRTIENSELDHVALYGYKMEVVTTQEKVILCLLDTSSIRRRDFFAESESTLQKVKTQVGVDTTGPSAIVIQRYITPKKAVYYFAGYEADSIPDRTLEEPFILKDMYSGKALKIIVTEKLNRVNWAYDAGTSFMEAYGMSVADAPWEERIPATSSESGKPEIHVFYPIH